MWNPRPTRSRTCSPKRRRAAAARADGGGDARGGSGDAPAAAQLKRRPTRSRRRARPLYSRSPDGARRVHVPAAPSPLAKRPGSAAEVMAAEVDRALVRDVSVVSLSPRALAR